MLEIEAKYALADAWTLEAVLARRGARFIEERTEVDHYFNAPDRDFAVTGEAFRIRQIGRRNLITWKGPRLVAVAKTREEIEIPFADGPEANDQLNTLLTRLGYREVEIVRKLRRVFALEQGCFEVQICIDAVEMVGLFAEVEIVAEPVHFEDAQATLLQLAEELGLTHMERRSYLKMLIEAKSKV